MSIELCCVWLVHLRQRIYEVISLLRVMDLFFPRVLCNEQLSKSQYQLDPVDSVIENNSLFFFGLLIVAGESSFKATFSFLEENQPTRRTYLP